MCILSCFRRNDTKIVYQKCKLVTIKEEYIPGFLAFREVEFLADLINELKHTNLKLVPQVIFVDGNGILHPRGFGLASHLGVLVDIPTIGIGKNLLFVDGLTKSAVRTNFDLNCHQAGGFVPKKKTKAKTKLSGNVMIWNHLNVLEKRKQILLLH